MNVTVRGRHAGAADHLHGRRAAATVSIRIDCPGHAAKDTTVKPRLHSIQDSGLIYVSFGKTDSGILMERLATDLPASWACPIRK